MSQLESSSMTFDHLPDSVKEALTYSLSDRSAVDLRLQTGEALKYLYLISAKGTSAFIPVVESVDQVWHELILQTKFYFELCSRLPGRNYIHHQTVPYSGYSRERDLATRRKEIVWWIPAYVSTFGDFTEEAAKVWAVCNFIEERLGLSLAQINEVGHNGQSEA